MEVAGVCAEFAAHAAPIIHAAPNVQPASFVAHAIKLPASLAMD